MPSYLGVKVESYRERAARYGTAEGGLENIAIAERELFEFVEGWMAKHPGDRTAADWLDSFLDDYFCDERRELADEADLDFSDTFGDRTALLDALKRGTPVAAAGDGSALAPVSDDAAASAGPIFKRGDRVIVGTCTPAVFVSMEPGFEEPWVRLSEPSGEGLAGWRISCWFAPLSQIRHPNAGVENSLPASGGAERRDGQ